MPMYSNIFALMVFFLCVIPASCATVDINSTFGGNVHRYSGVNDIIVPYVGKWMNLAKVRNLSFKHSIGIGFSNTEGITVGLTRYENGFKEIDVDYKYWSLSSEAQKTVLIWHELAHAYCDRFHDNGENNKYGDIIAIATKLREEGGPGFYSDHCPKSLMFPSVIAEDCFKKYYTSYIDEMFENCKPY